MFQFRRFPSYAYFFQHMMHELLSCGLLHSDICGSFHACWSPQLFAAYHVLLRLLMPRHSPYPLISLTIWIMLILFASFANCRLFKTFFLNYPTSNLSIICRFPHLHYFLHYSIFKLPSYNVFSPLVFSTSFLIRIALKFAVLIFLTAGGHKWTRTTDLTLIRRAL